MLLITLGYVKKREKPRKAVTSPREMATGAAVDHARAGLGMEGGRTGRILTTLGTNAPKTAAPEQ